MGKTCTFATSCWERDWKQILLTPGYLETKQIANHRFAFSEKLLFINNVSDLAAVKCAAEDLVRAGVLTRYFVIAEIAFEILSFFQLQKSDFKMGTNTMGYAGVNDDWVYYNALSPLAAIYMASSEYLLYLTGDVRLDHPFAWIEKAMRVMEKNEQIQVANPVWNGAYKEAKKESFRKSWNFFFAKEGFSDQLFLVKRSFFRRPIYHEIREDSQHYPVGDLFEKRVFSYLKNRGMQRMIYRHGTYVHENIGV